MTKKICILGKLETKFQAPFDDPKWEIWTMNKHSDGALLPRVDKWFDIHTHTDTSTYNHNADIKYEDFPFKECHKLVGGKYFNNTVSYLIAYAILQGATHIALYGMRFTADHERRRKELYNTRQMIFFAKGKGIEVTMPADKLFLLPECWVEEGRDFDQ